MRIALISDTHIGITHPGDLIRLCQELKKEAPDVICHAGDFNGGTNGFNAVAATIDIIQVQLPNVPIVACLGNHDRWTPEATLNSYVENLNSITAYFKSEGVHFVDKDGVYRHPKHLGIALFGSSGWYRDFRDNNDWNYIPNKIEGHTHSHLQKESYEVAFQNASALNPRDHTRIFLSHMPVIDPKDYGWDEQIGELLQNEFSVTHFLSGHMHERREGPLSYECGSNYYLPRYLPIEIK